MKRRVLACKSPSLWSHEERHRSKFSLMNGLNARVLALDKFEGSCCHGSKPGFNESAEA